MVRSLPHLLVLQILFMKRNKSYDKLSIEDVDKAIRKLQRPNKIGNFYVLPGYTVVAIILIIWCSRFSFFIMQKGNI